MSAGKQQTLEEDGAFPGYTQWYSEHMHHVNRLFNDPQLDRMNLYTSRVAEPQYDDILQQTRLDNLHMMFRTESTTLSGDLVNNNGLLFWDSCSGEVAMAADLDLVNLFIIAAGTLAIPILAFVASFLLWPSALIKVYYWYWRRTLGLQVRYADCGGYRFCYSYRGKPGMRPSILMLHGFSAHKDTWLTVIKYLPKHLHLVCVDMPGHEGTTRTNTEDYSIQGQVRRIHQFVETIRLTRKPFHLVGTSMGGNVAGVYAACYPSEICSMTLICPDGIRHPCETKFDNHLQDLEHSNYTLNIPLIPTTPEEMEDMFRLCSHVRFKIPQQILQGLVDVRQPHNIFYQEVFMEIVSEKSRYALQDHLHLITAPLHVIWGKQDQVVDVSGATVIAEALPGCRVDLLENCGHSVVMERPCRTAKLILEFIILQQDARGGTKKSS